MESANQWFENRFVQMLGGDGDPEFIKTVRRLVRASINQHSCLSLDQLDPGAIETIASHSAVGKPGTGKPITLWNNNLYLTRIYRLEEEVANHIVSRNQSLPEQPSNILELLEESFGPAPDSQQKLAALIAVTRQLAIVTGGPGTGKTTTVVSILKILGQTNPELRISLAAPTGKAAMRLGASIQEEMKDSQLQVHTLHRLLGMRRDGRTFRHDADNPLPVDLLVIDEASMIDLALMDRVLNALRPEARLILLGDPNQLPSVDTGNVLADLCSGEPGFSRSFINRYSGADIDIVETTAPDKLTDAVCELRTSHRFSADSSIGKIAASLQSDDPEWPTETDESVAMSPEIDLSNIGMLWSSYYDLIQGKDIDPAELLSRFEETRILCSRRSGSDGVEAINNRIEHALEASGHKPPTEHFYTGRPILITRNDYKLGLFNGDIGLCLPDPESDEFFVHFSDGTRLPAARLPDHETCFAMTVHKAQGSEFGHVILVLDEDSTEELENLMTRELVYTAVTRSRNRFTAVTTPERWTRAVHRQTTRISGMKNFISLVSA